MGKLEDLNKKLFSADFLGRKRTHRQSLERPDSAREPWVFEPEELKRGELAKKQHSYVMVLFGLLIGVGIIFSFGYWTLQSGILFNLLGKTEVELLIVAPTEVIAGDRITYSVIYRNKSKNAIHDVELFFEYPKGSEIIGDFDDGIDPQSLRVRVPIDTIPPYMERDFDFTSRIFGKDGVPFVARATLKYTPENASSRFEVKKDHSLKIVHVPIAIDLKGAEEVLSGELKEYVIEYVSNASAQFRDIALRLTIPDGFQVLDFGTDPFYKDEKEFVWDIGSILPGSSGSISVRGILSGSPLEPKSFQYGLGIYNKETHEWVPYIERILTSKIIESQLFIQTTIQGKRQTSVALGESVSGVILYKNNSNTPFKNLTITVVIDGPIDPASLRVFGGAVLDSRTIQWKVATDPALRLLSVGGMRNLSFSFNTSRPNRVGNIKNMEIGITARIIAEKDQTADVTPEGNDAVMIQVQAVPYFIAKALYSGTVITNTGPIPPKVGKETTYTIVWEIGSFGGNLDDVMVRATLPLYMKWKKLIIPSGSAISYNSITNEIVWNPGRILASEFDSSTAKVSFQVGLTPSQSQIGFTPDIVGETSIEGVDVFTKNNIQRTVRSIDTNLLDDFGVPPNSGRVNE